MCIISTANDDCSSILFVFFDAIEGLALTIASFFAMFAFSRRSLKGISYGQVQVARSHQYLATSLPADYRHNKLIY
jgi:hypothetical protein